jgi:FkbH-like protein
MNVLSGAIGAKAERPAVKCVVWDLDDTLWEGTLLEGDDPVVRPNVRAILEELDNRGILNAIASKNDRELVLGKLAELEIADYFVCSEIRWCNKSDSIKAIATELGLGLDSLFFVDDQAFERDEVSSALNEVETFDPAHLNDLLLLPRMRPLHITAESKSRRKMYQADIARKQSENTFIGTREEFLQTLEMRITIRQGSEADLARLAELTVRTNQLNTTGYPYSPEQLQALLGSKSHRLLVVTLEDRYGSSGTIGLALIELKPEAWLLKLMIMSCRVISRGIGSILLGYILHAARDNGVVVEAEFTDSGRNRMMYITYKFAGFIEKSSHGEVQLLQHDLHAIKPLPPFVTLDAPGFSTP